MERETAMDTRDSLSVRTSETTSIARRSIINTVNDRQGKRASDASIINRGDTSYRVSGIEGT